MADAEREVDELRSRDVLSVQELNELLY